MITERINNRVDRLTDAFNRLSTRQRLTIAGAAFVVLAIAPFFMTNLFLMNTMIYIFLFIGLGQAWNIIGGYGGQISLGHAIMFAAGAYTTAILFVRHDITPLVGLFVGGVVATILGLILGFVTFRLRYHYFAMATLVAALIARTVAFRWEYINGAQGIRYPLDTLGSWVALTFSDKLPYYFIIGFAALIVTLLVYRMDHSKLGIYLQAINEDQELAQNAGINVFQYKMYAMGLSSFIAGFFGGFYAQYLLYLNPISTLRVLRNIDIVIVPIIGGVGTVLGPVAGAFLFIPIREYTRTILSGNYTGLGWVVVGVILVLISIYRPGGLLNEDYGK